MADVTTRKQTGKHVMARNRLVEPIEYGILCVCDGLSQLMLGMGSEEFLSAVK